MIRNFNLRFEIEVLGSQTGPYGKPLAVSTLHLLITVKQSPVINLNGMVTVVTTGIEALKLEALKRFETKGAEWAEWGFPMTCWPSLLTARGYLVLSFSHRLLGLPAFEDLQVR